MFINIKEYKFDRISKVSTKGKTVLRQLLLNSTKFNDKFSKQEYKEISKEEFLKRPSQIQDKR